MNYFVWIFASLFTVSFFLTLFSYVKKFIPQTKVFRCFMLPFLFLIFVSVLYQRMPDSFHLIILTGLSFFFSELSFIFDFTPHKKILTAISHACIFLSINVWTNFYYSTLFLVRIPNWFKWIFIFLFTVLFLGLAFINRSKTFYFHIYEAACIWASGFLTFTGFAELFFAPSIHSAIRILGALAFTLYVSLRVTSFCLFSTKHQIFINSMLLILAQATIAGASLIMIF